jgi:hypothetical protein
MFRGGSFWWGLSSDRDILCLESPELNLDPDVAVSLGEEIAY